MKNIATFGLLILVTSMVFGGMTDVFAQNDPAIILKLAKHAQEQIHNQIFIDSSDNIKILFEEGKQKVNALEESLRIDDIISAQEYFFSAMKIFTEISRQLATPDATTQTTMNSLKSDVKDPSNHLKRLQGYVDSLKTIAKKHNTLIDFSELDELFVKARQQISDNQFTSAVGTLHEIKDVIVKVKTELHEEALKQESKRAKQYAQRYLEQLERLIENAKKQGVTDEIIEELETSKDNLSTAENPGEIVKEIRKIMLIKNQFESTKIDQLESRVLQIEKTLFRLSQVDRIDQENLATAKDMLQSIKHNLYEGKFDMANEILQNLANQLEEIKNSL